jgi:hypothetical protein
MSPDQRRDVALWIGWLLAVVFTGMVAVAFFEAKGL